MFEFAYNEIVDESPQAMRAQERRALDHVIDLLREGSRRAAGRARWSTRSINSAASGSSSSTISTTRRMRCPSSCAPGLISIGIWVNKEIDRISSGAATDLTPLIEINEIIRDGLK